MLKSKFTQKIMLLAVLPVLVFTTLSVIVLSVQVNRFGATASDVAFEALETLYRETMRERSEDVGYNIMLKLNAVHAELNFVRAYAQRLIDEGEQSLSHPTATTPEMPFELNYDAQYHWVSSQPNRHNVSLSVWGYLLDASGRLLSSTEQYIRSMSPVVEMLSTLGKHGSEKGWFYLAGPHQMPVLMVYPWANIPALFEQSAPGYNAHNWWDYFFPGVTEAWNQWVKADNFDARAPADQVTWTPIYDDAAGTGLMVTFWAPLWTADRHQNYGTVGIDYNISNIVTMLSKEKLGEQGYFFLLKSNGDGLGLSDSQLAQLSILPAVNDSVGVVLNSFNLNNSSIAELAQLSQRLTHIDAFASFPFVDNEGKPYLISFKRLTEFNLWTGKEGITKDALFVAALLPMDELLAKQSNMNNHIQQISQESIVIISVVSLLMAFIASFLAASYAFKATKQLRLMRHAVQQVTSQQYDTQVAVMSEDDLGDLATSFNSMIMEIASSYQQLSDYANGLEDKVAERTAHLAESNRQLQVATLKAQIALEDNQHLMSMLSHEVRSPVAAISNCVAVIEKALQKQELHYIPDMLQRIEHAIKRLTNFMEGLTAEDRLNQLMTQEPQTLVLSEFVQQVVDTVKHHHEVAHIDVSLSGKLTATIPDTVLFDVLLTNLLDNAIKYSPVSSTVSLLVSVSEQDELQLIVEDEGMGIDESFVPDLFKKYKRSRQVEHIGGSGLGLYIVYRIVNLFNGRILINNRDTVGTRVQINLPAAAKRADHD